MPSGDMFQIPSKADDEMLRTNAIWVTGGAHRE